MSANDFVVERVSSGTVDVDGLQDDLRTLLSGMKAVYTYGDGDRVRVRLR
jgi:hypothetical protein